MFMKMTYNYQGSVLRMPECQTEITFPLQEYMQYLISKLESYLEICQRTGKCY